MLDALAAAIEEVQVHPHEGELAQAFWLRDRLDAAILTAVSEFDAAELWDTDGSASMAAWLRIHAGRTQREAARLASTARRLRALPSVADAFRAGTLRGGQVEAIVGIVTERTLPLFTEQEDLLLGTLLGLAITDTVAFLQGWQARAEAFLDSLDPAPEPDEPRRSLHLSGLLDGRARLDADLDPEAHGLLRSALRLAEARYRSGDDAPSAAERHADALVDIVRFFLDHQTTHPGGRHRPHLSVVVDLPELTGGGPGRTLEGLPLDPATVARIACDAALHRVITAGPGSILDYGRTTRTIPPAVYTALVLRDHGCRFPGCDRPADWCEGHHILEWEQGGPTCLPNLVLLCSRHHHRIHLHGWQLKLLPHGTVEVTQPDGTVRTSDPPRRSTG